MNKKLLLGVLVVVVGAGVIAYFYPQGSDSLQVQSGDTSQADQISPVASVPGWTTCSYPGFGFSVQYPPEWSASFISGAQGAGSNVIVARCGEIDARSVLPQITFGLEDQTMKLTIRDQKGGVPDESAARAQIQNSGSTIYNGKQYSIVFSSAVSTDTKAKILSTFDFQ